MRIVVIFSWVVVASASLGCSGDEVCVEIDEACQPSYEPTFDNIFANTITPNCAPSGTACHSVDGARAGLILVDPDQSYSLLVRSGGAVEPGDDSCSLLSQRVASPNANFQMPPGAPLDAGEVCAIQKWIADGAVR